MLIVFWKVFNWYACKLCMIVAAYTDSETSWFKTNSASTNLVLALNKKDFIIKLFMWEGNFSVNNFQIPVRK